MQLSTKDILEYHLGGKVGLKLTKPLCAIEDLCMAYTPGVAVPVQEIARDPHAVHQYTSKDNLVAVVTDGTAILGLGDLGATASIPVMEGKAVLFKAFADIDAWPVPLDHCRMDGKSSGPTDPNRVVEAVSVIAPMYGGINLEDIAAPACFEIEDRLDSLLDIPVFHDDQWGTAVITLAATKNYCILSRRDISELKVVINGAGAAGIRIAEMLKTAGVKELILCDSKGVIKTGRTDLTKKKQEHAVRTSASTVGEAMRGAHVFIGVSVADCIKPSDVKAMAAYPAVFAMANPNPEILPEAVAEALGKEPYVMATGRSDYPNQINNVLGFPFLFRGALDTLARRINIEMKLAASEALAALAREPVPEYLKDLYGNKELSFNRGYIIPKPFDRRLVVHVPYAVAEAAVRTKTARITNLDGYRARLEKRYGIAML